MWTHCQDPLDMYVTVINVDVLMGRETVWHLAKNAINVVVKTTSEKCVDLARDLINMINLSQDVIQESQARPRADARISVNFMR